MTYTPEISVVTVTFNGRAFLDDFFTSLLATDQQGLKLEIIMVDNGSTDGSVDWVRNQYPQVNVLQNDENNYAGALNLGIRTSKGQYVAITNNDAKVHPGWLHGFLEVFQSDKKIGAVQSKIYFAQDGKLNSVGVEEIERFYFRDTGFGEDDSVRYSHPAEREYITGGSVMFRRECLDDVGDWDEEFIMFMEDVDYSVRCRRKGWQLWYAPNSIFYHQYHGSTSTGLCEYFCSRNRFLFVAKHFPLELAESIPNSHFYKNAEYDLLCHALLHAVKKLCSCQDTETVVKVLRSLKACLPGYLGEVSAYTFFSQLELILGLRKIRVGIYDHAGHFAGGGQRYVAEMAVIMQERYDITYIFNNDVQLSDYQDWFDLDLTQCATKVIRIPFFDEHKRDMPDEGIVTRGIINYFDVISRESLNYDIFVNANMLGKVNPLSPVSLFVCHFPDQEMNRFFQVDKYNHLMINSDYTGEWVQKRWQLTPTDKLYPPVNMYNLDSSLENKESIILSVSRFATSGSKKQVELVRAFDEMVQQYPQETRGWKLVLLGGSPAENSYLKMIEAAVSNAQCSVEVRANAPVAEIKDYYRRAAIFWHACGLNETRPELVEHFGMTTVEAMQNYCVPIVIDGGGQREIVEHGESGFRFSTIDELIGFSLSVIGDAKRRKSLAENAFGRSHLFNRDVFKGKLDALLDQVELELLGSDSLPRPKGRALVSIEQGG